MSISGWEHLLSDMFCWTAILFLLTANVGGVADHVSSHITKPLALIGLVFGDLTLILMTANIVLIAWEAWQ